MPLPFKSYLKKPSVYKGGKSKEEVATNGKKLYKLSSNENPIGASPKAMAAIQSHLSNLHEYPNRTDQRLREALSMFYQGELAPNQFISTNSGVANLELIMRGFLQEGTECIYSNPAFGPYKSFPKKLGAKAIDIPLVGEHFHLNVEGILNAINEHTRLIFITSPNNPTGTHLPQAQIDQLIHQLPDHVIVVFDEVYYQFADTDDFVRALPYVKEGKNVIAVNSFSKAYGLAGLRIGYSYSTPEIATYLHQLRIPFMINSLSLEAAIAALKDDAFIENTVQLVHQEKEYLYEQLQQLGIQYWKTQANFILIQPAMNPVEFETALLQEGVMVRPVAGFGAPDCVRVTIGNREANEAFVKGLKNVLGR